MPRHALLHVHEGVLLVVPLLRGCEGVLLLIAEEAAALLIVIGEAATLLDKGGRGTPYCLVIVGEAAALLIVGEAAALLIMRDRRAP